MKLSTHLSEYNYQTQIQEILEDGLYRKYFDVEDGRYCR